jgi:hypothetical protein
LENGTRRRYSGGFSHYKTDGHSKHQARGRTIGPESRNIVAFPTLPLGVFPFVGPRNCEFSLCCVAGCSENKLTLMYTRGSPPPGGGPIVAKHDGDDDSAEDIFSALREQ